MAEKARNTADTPRWDLYPSDAPEVFERRPDLARDYEGGAQKSEQNVGRAGAAIRHNSDRLLASGEESGGIRRKFEVIRSQTREQASQIAERARDVADEFSQRAMVTAEEWTDTARAKSIEWRENARRGYWQVRQRAERTVCDYPLQTLAGILAGAFVIGAAIRYWRSRDEY